MTTVSQAVSADGDSRAESGSALVDPRAPRFGQMLTASLLFAAVALGEPRFVYLVAAVLNVAFLSQWRVDAYGFLWRRVVVPVVGPPEAREPAAPHRFAKVLGAAGTAVASGLLVAGVPLAGFVVAGAVAAAAGLAAVSGICLGCRMYRQVALFRRLDLV